MNEQIFEDEMELMDYLNALWKRKWLIIIFTLVCVIAMGIVSFLLPSKWEVEILMQPSKFVVKTEQGNFEEVLVTPPQQIAGQINERSYNQIIAAELNLDMKKFPELEAQTLKDTSLIRVSTETDEVEKAQAVFLSLFKHLKIELDRKVDVEMKNLDTQIATWQNKIQHNRLVIKDNLNEIELKKIEKNKTAQEIISAKNKLDISKERVKSIMEEMGKVKSRIEEIEEQQKNALAEKKQVNDAISLLLYSNEIQHNLRYYNTLDEKLSNESITQENLSLSIENKKEDIKMLDKEIEKLRNNIDKIENEIENIKNHKAHVEDQKARIDYAQLVKEPTLSLYPVSPKKKLNVFIAGILGLFISTFLALFLDYVQKHKGDTQT